MFVLLCSERWLALLPRMGQGQLNWHSSVEISGNYLEVQERKFWMLLNGRCVGDGP